MRDLNRQRDPVSGQRSRADKINKNDTQMTPQRWTRACRGQFSGSRCGFGVMADGDLCQAATLRLFGFAFLSGEAFSKGGRAPGPGWT
jgi:hypothetical protein